MSQLKQAIALLDKARDGDETAADSLEMLIRSYFAETTDTPLKGGPKFSKHESRIVARLFNKPGERVPRNALLDAMYFDSPDGAPTTDSFGVMLHRIRKKLTGTKYGIPKELPRSGSYQGIILA